MRRLFRIGVAAVLGGVVLAGLAGNRHASSKQDKREVARLTDRMKTHCIGRFLIDMLEEALVELGQPSIDGFDIAAFEETVEEFQKRLAEHESQIRSKPNQGAGRIIWSP